MTYAWLLVLIFISEPYTIMIPGLASSKACHDLAHSMGYTRETYPDSFLLSNRGDHECKRYEMAR